MAKINNTAMVNGRVCANSNCHHTEAEHEPGLGCWGKPKMLRTDGPTPGCRCTGFVARRDTAMSPQAEPVVKRFRFVEDEDGHTYMIPADMEEQFHKWVQIMPGDLDEEGYVGQDFEEYSIGGAASQYTFTDPREDA